MEKLHIGKKEIEIKAEWKLGFLATWVFGLLAHAYRFFNFLPTWDSMYNFTGTGATFIREDASSDFSADFPPNMTCHG